MPKYTLIARRSDGTSRVFLYDDPRRLESYLLRAVDANKMPLVEAAAIMMVAHKESKNA